MIGAGIFRLGTTIITDFDMIITPSYDQQFLSSVKAPEPKKGVQECDF
jgi:hypothetical protein